MTLAAGLRYCLVVCLVPVCCAIQGTASWGTREFPADVKASDWLSDPKAKEYQQQLVIQSGGFGIAIGILFTILMFFHLLCWGYCCECCRCCCCTLASTRTAGCFQRKHRTRWAVVAVLLVVLSIVGVIIIAVQSSTIYEKVSLTFDNAKQVLVDASDFQCAGALSESLRNGTSLDEFKRLRGSTLGVLQLCNDGTVGSFLFQGVKTLNSTFDRILNTINGYENIITSLNNVIYEVENTTSLVVKINSTVFAMGNQSALLTKNLQVVSATGNFNGRIPNSSNIPKPTTTEYYVSTVVSASLAVIRSNLVSSRNSLNVTISDLISSTSITITQQWNKILGNMGNAADKMLSSFQGLIDYETNVDDVKANSTSSETYGELLLAAIYTTMVVCLLFMISGFFCKKLWPLCCGMYGIFILFCWLCLILGLFLIFSMLTYDICGCEGTYSSDTCSNIMTIMRTNTADRNISLNGVNVNIVESIEKILTCPSRSNATTNYIYSPDSNFIDILKLLDAFNFTDLVSKPINELTSSIPGFNITKEVNNALSQASVSKSTMAAISVGHGYNFTADSAQYSETLVGLTTNEPTYYPTPQPITVRAYNRVYLTENLRVNNEMKINRDNLEIYKGEFNTSIDRIVSAVNSIDSSVLKARADLLNATASIEDAVKFVLTINRYTPCAFLGKAYNNLLIGSFCRDTYTSFDGVVPGAIITMVASLLGFFVIGMMRDCVIFDLEERVHSIKEHTAEYKEQDGKLNSGSPDGHAAGGGIVAPPKHVIDYTDGTPVSRAPNALPDAPEYLEEGAELSTIPKEENARLMKLKEPAPTGEVDGNGSAPI